MILTAHQPAYLPWLGYFEKIMRSDVYVFMDSVQFEKNSFINRNKIITAQGVTWLTVPVYSKGHIGSNMMELYIDNKKKWQRKHYNAITLSYKKAVNYNNIIEKIKNFYDKEYEKFIDFCYDYTVFWFKELNISTKLVRLSELNIDAKKSDLVLEMCKYFNADTYISGSLGINYLDELKFKNNGINIIYQNYKLLEYPQLWTEEFIPYMSIIDFVMNNKNYALISEGGSY